MKNDKPHNGSIFGSNPLSILLIPRLRTYGGLVILILFLTACPDLPETTDCGANQVKVNGDCECEEGYHWNEDQTKCLMDTTSHNFVWTIDTLGISGSLRDVQIINQNNIWVIGEIETDSGKYGGAQWTGNNWVLMKFPGEGYDFTAPIRGLYHFDDNNIWLAAGSIFHWDGTEVTRMWSRNTNTDETVEKIWASSENDIYFVGNEGTIVHYDGTVFTKMTSPTTQNLDGIVGVVDSETGEKRIWINGWSDYPNGGLLLQYNGTDWEIVWDENNPFFEDSQYVTPTLHIPDEKYLVVYSGGTDHGILSIHEQKDLHQYEIIHQNYNGAIRSISGDKINDISRSW